MSFKLRKISYGITSAGLGHLSAEMGRAYKPFVRRYLKEVGKQARIYLADLTAAKKAVATGKLMRGWRVRHAPWYRIKIYNRTKHTIFVERGRRAGARMPPVAVIRKWCEIKGIDPRAAYPIAKKIARDGIVARPLITSDEFRRRLRRIHRRTLKAELKKYRTKAARKANRVRR